MSIQAYKVGSSTIIIHCLHITIHIVVNVLDEPKSGEDSENVSPNIGDPSSRTGSSGKQVSNQSCLVYSLFLLTGSFGESHISPQTLPTTDITDKLSSPTELPDFGATIDEYIDTLTSSISKLDLAESPPTDPGCTPPVVTPVDSKTDPIPFRLHHPPSSPTIACCVPPTETPAAVTEQIPICSQSPPTKVDSKRTVTKQIPFCVLPSSPPPTIASCVPPTATPAASKHAAVTDICSRSPPTNIFSADSKHTVTRQIPFCVLPPSPPPPPTIASCIPVASKYSVINPSLFHPSSLPLSSRLKRNTSPGSPCSSVESSTGDKKSQHSASKSEPQLVSAVNQPIASAKISTQHSPSHSEQQNAPVQMLLGEIMRLEKAHQKISKRLKQQTRGRSGTIKTSKPHDQTGEQQKQNQPLPEEIQEERRPTPREERLTISAQLAVTRKLAMQMNEPVRPDTIERVPAIFVPYLSPPLPPPRYLISSDCPEPYKVCGITTENCLASDNIIRGDLVSVEEVLVKYGNLIRMRDARPIHICKLCVMLAKEAIFGVQIMMACNVTGKGEIYPGLPYPELCLLKKILLEQYPQYWDNLDRFELIWARCVKALRYACRSERIEMSKHLTQDAIEGVFGGHLS